MPAMMGLYAVPVLRGVVGFLQLMLITIRACCAAVWMVITRSGLAVGFLRLELQSITFIPHPITEKYRN